MYFVKKDMFTLTTTMQSMPCVIIILTVVFLFFVGKYWCPNYSDTLLLTLSGKSAGQMANMELYMYIYIYIYIYIYTYTVSVDIFFSWI